MIIIYFLRHNAQEKAIWVGKYLLVIRRFHKIQSPFRDNGYLNGFFFFMIAPPGLDANAL
jgi:hypothetical protein